MDVLCPKCRRPLPSSFIFCPMCGAEINPPEKPKVRRRPKGTGSVYIVGGNRKEPWVAKLNGKVLGYFPDRPTAEKFLAENSVKDTRLINLTLEDIYNRVLASQSYQRLSAGTKNNLRISWDKLKVKKDIKIRNMKTIHFQSVINAAAANGCGRDGCAKIKTLASMLCQNAMLDDIIERDYSQGIELPAYTQTVKRRNFTEEEILTLFYEDEDRDARIVLTMIYSATRIGELFGILKANVNLEKRYMIGGEKTEAGKDRIIPIRDEIYPYVQGFMQEPGDYLISSPTGKKINTNNFRNRSFYALFDRLGFNYKDEKGNNLLTPHRTRHTYISESIMAGVRPEALKKIVGHASYKTSVDKYDELVNLDFLQQEAKKGL